MARPGIVITVGGVPWEKLTDEHKEKVIKRNTDIAAEIFTREVARMAEENKGIEEISRFLGLEK